MIVNDMLICLNYGEIKMIIPYRVMTRAKHQSTNEPFLLIKQKKNWPITPICWLKLPQNTANWCLITKRFLAINES